MKMVLVSVAIIIPKNGTYEDSTVLARDASPNSNDLYVCSWFEFKECEGVHWHNNSLEDAIKYYSSYYEDCEVEIYEQ